MENTNPNDPTLALVSLLVNRSLNDPNEPPAETKVKSGEDTKVMEDHLFKSACESGTFKTGFAITGTGLKFPLMNAEAIVNPKKVL